MPEHFVIIRKNGAYEYWRQSSRGTERLAGGAAKIVGQAGNSGTPRAKWDWVVTLEGWGTQFVSVLRSDTLHMESTRPSPSDSVDSADYVRVLETALTPPSPNIQPRAPSVPLPKGVSYYPDESLDVPPSPLEAVAPTYPEFARDAGIHGQVGVHCLIGIDGRVKNTKIVQSVTGLDQAVIHAVMQWRFTPGYRAGQPIPSWAQLRFDF